MHADDAAAAEQRAFASAEDLPCDPVRFAPAPAGELLRLEPAAAKREKGARLDANHVAGWIKEAAPAASGATAKLEAMVSTACQVKPLPTSRS